MFIIFNIIVIGLAGLIAYWWANQGFLSAMLHFLCVVAAGAIAFALWEPLTVNYMLRGGGFDQFAWSVSLLGTFAVALFILRLACDKIVPDNLNLPTWMNYVFGGVFGAAAGVLTMGIVMIGAGFAQSTVEILDFRGQARARTGGQPVRIQTPWLPMHTITSEFYAFASAGSFAPTFSRASLRQSYPQLDDMAASLFRDSWDEGRGLVTVNPSAVRIDGFGFAPDVDTSAFFRGVNPAALVRVTFDKEAYDYGERLTLTASQVRLIGRRPRDGRSEPPVSHPILWMAPNQETGVGLHRFDDLSHVATGIPGQQSTTITLVFPAGGFGQNPPEFIQIKGVRFRLPTPVNDMGGIAQMLAAAAASAPVPTAGEAAPGTPSLSGAGGTTAPVRPAAPRADGSVAPSDIVVNNNLGRLFLSKNEISPMREIDNYLSEGRREFGYQGTFGAGQALRIRGIHQPPGTRIVKLNASRTTSSVDIFGDTNDARQTEGDNAPLVLVDTNGSRYQPIGFIWEKPNNAEVMLDPSRGIRRVGDLPALPTAGTHTLWVIFRVTDGVTISEVALGSRTLGTTNLLAEQAR